MRLLYWPVLLLLALALLSSCKDEPGGAAPAGRPAGKDGPQLSLSGFKFSRIEGIYQGGFGGSNIRLALSHATGRHATGYTLHKGLRRNFSGSMSGAAKGFSFTMNEPGDNPYDGIFSFEIDTATLALSGSWKPYKADATSAKTFTLRRAESPAPDSNRLWEPTEYSDTLGGTYDFRDDGLATYQTYRDRNGRETKQKITVRGSWHAEGNVYTIDWGANEVLPDRKMIFRKTEDTTDGMRGYYYMLTGDDRKLYPVEAP